MTAASNDPSDVAFDKMITAAFDTCDALTDFYCHMEDVRRNALAGISTPEDKAQTLVGVIHEAHDRYFEAACEFDDLSDTCAECQAKEAATNERGVTCHATPEAEAIGAAKRAAEEAAAPTPAPAKPNPATHRGFH